jgi:SMC interacting uncharacterized protein involved in chromosome segregation
MLRGGAGTGASAGPRSSIAPQGMRSRQSLIPHAAKPHEAKPYDPKPARRSMLPGARPEMSSGQRGDAGFYRPQGNANLLNSARRSSVYPSAPSGRQSIMPPAGGGQKDPRRDPAFRAECRANVDNFLQVNGMPPLSTKTKDPIQKEIEATFRAIAEKLVGPTTRGKKFEDDCTAMLRDLKCPYQEYLSKSAIAVAGSEKYWPLMLATLSWMVDLCRVSWENEAEG